MKYVLAVDIGGTTVKFGIFEDTGTLVESWSAPTRTENAGAFILPDCAEQISGELRRLGLRQEDATGIGLGVPGPVDEDGLVRGAPNLGWGNLRAGEVLAGLTGIPRVIAANDADAAALGEYAAGAGRDFRSFAFVTLGTGIGCGLVSNGRIVTGAHGAAGEIGHLKMSWEEKRYCGCGKRGCLEQYASGSGIARIAQDLLASSEPEDPPSLLRRVPAPTGKDVFDCAACGDRIALEAADRAARLLGTALSYISAVFDPEAIVIGGGVAQAGELLLAPVRKYYREAVYAPSRETPILTASLGSSAGLYGTAQLILQESADPRQANQE